MAATATTNFNLLKPVYGDSADIEVINDDMDDIDLIMHQNRYMTAPAYDQTQSYSVGNIVEYLGSLYRCTGATTGNWDSSKWTQTTLAAEVQNGGGGTDVEANPSGTASADLNKLRVGQTIYGIPSASDMTGATSSTAGTHGLVPAPAAGDESKVLMGDGTWGEVHGGASELGDLEDVNITTPSEGQALTYDDTNDEWVNSDLPTPTKRVTGNPVEFTDGANAPLVKCVSAITGSQDLHGYDKPWVGGAGTNILDESLFVYGKWIDNGNNVGDITDRKATIQYIPCNGGSSYFIGAYDNNQIVISTYLINILWYDSTYAFLSNQSVDVSGSVITFPSNASYFRIALSINTYNCAVNFPSTATTFAPYSNICPITAYTEGEIEVRGRNIIDWKVNTTSNKWEGTLRPGTYTISAESTLSNGNWYFRFSRGTEEYPYSASECGFSSFAKAQSGWFYGGEIYQKVTFIVPSDCTLLEIGKLNANGTISAQLEKGTTATTYEPYTSTTHTTTYPSAIYRGSEDVVNGEVTKEWVKTVLTGNESWTKYDVAQGTLFRLYMPGIEIISSAWVTPNVICSRYEVVVSGNRTNHTLSQPASLEAIDIIDDDYSDASTFATAMAGLEIAYKLATPTTSSVTPTNLPIKSLNGYSHIESTTGDMEVEYITQGEQPILDLIESSSGSSMHNYSTTEQVVGKWIDGKDLYEKVVVNSSTLVVGNNSISIPTDATTIVSATGIFVSGTYSNPLNYYAESANGALAVDELNATSHTLRVRIGSDYSSLLTGANVYITIHYTKTSSSTRSLSAPLTSQKAQIEPLTDKTEEVPTEEEKAENETVEEPVEETKEPVEPSEEEEEEHEAER